MVGSFIAGVGYRGKQGEAYSPLNHFISELGEVEVSRIAWAFDLGLILSGISLIGASISLGLMLPGLLAKIGMGLGIICSIALALVGIFPMNKIKPHGCTAMTYFRSGLLMMLFINLAIGLQQESAQVIPKTYSLAGLPAILSFANFLVMMGKSKKNGIIIPYPLKTWSGLKFGLKRSRNGLLYNDCDLVSGECNWFINQSDFDELTRFLDNWGGKG